MNGIGRLIDEGKYRDAVLGLERLLLSGGEAGGWLDRLPDAYAMRSPVLQLERGRRLLLEERLREAADCLAKAVQGLAYYGHRGQLVTALALLGLVCLRLGRVQDADTLLDFLANERPEDGLPDDGPASGCIHWLLGMRLAWKRELRQADGAYSEALRAFAKARETGFYHAARLDRALTFGRRTPRTVESALDCPVIGGPDDGRGESSDAMLQALRQFEEGEWKDASLALERLAGQDAPERRPLLVLLALQARLLGGLPLDREAAEACLESVRQEEADVRLRAEAAIARALYDSRFGRVDQPGDAAEAIRRIGESNGWAAAEWKIAAASAAAAAAPAADRPAGSASLAETHAAVRDAAPWRIHCFNGLRFENGSRDIRQVDWKRKKAQELFLFLALQPGYAATRELVTETLFPDASPGQMANQLYVIVHRLKEIGNAALGHARAVAVKDGVVRLDETMIDYVDAEKYDALARVGDQLWPKDRAQAVKLYEDAVQLYGELLPELPYVDWVAERRERYDRRQAELLQRLGRHFDEIGDLEQAYRYRKEWATLDPYEETAYQALMRVLLRMGRKPEARIWYEKLAAVCREQLQAEPAAESTAMFEASRR